MKKLLGICILWAVFSSCSGTLMSSRVPPGGTVIIGPNNNIVRRRVVIRNKSKIPMVAKTYKNGKESSTTTIRPNSRQKIYVDHNSQIEVDNNQKTPSQVKIKVPGKQGVGIRSTRKSR